MRRGGKRIVNFTVTNFCNASCVFCSFHNEPHPRMVSPTKGDRAVDFWADNDAGMISFTGGEPLLNPGLPQMVARASRMDMITVTGSNGILLTRDIARSLVRAGLDAMWLSFESASPAEFERNRGVPGLHKRIVQAARDLRAEGLDFFAIALINRSMGDVEGLADRLLEMGFDKVKFDYPMGFELQSTYRGWSLSPLLRFSGAQMRKIIGDIIHLKKGSRIRVLNPLGGLEGAQSFFSGGGGRFPCYAGSRILYTDVDLDIYRCPALPERMGAVGDQIDFCRKDCERCYYQGVRDFGPFYYLLETIHSVGAGGVREAYGRLDRRLLRALADANDIRTGGIA